jgi:phospholipid transport system transporter-binding protein
MSATPFPADVMLEDARAALDAARAACAAGGVVDLAGLQRFDSAAVAVLVAMRREFGSNLRFDAPPANLRNLAALYGVEELIFGGRA